MPNRDDQLLQKLRLQIDQLHDRSFSGDPLVQDKIVALANYADFIMGLTQPVATPPSGSTAHSASLTCPRCSGKVNVTLS